MSASQRSESKWEAMEARRDAHDGEAPGFTLSPVVDADPLLDAVEGGVCGTVVGVKRGAVDERVVDGGEEGSDVDDGGEGNDVHEVVDTLVVGSDVEGVDTLELDVVRVDALELDVAGGVDTLVLLVDVVFETLASARLATPLTHRVPSKAK